MGNDGRTGGQVVVAVRQSAVDVQADGLIGVSYRRCDGGGWSDGRVGCRTDGGMLADGLTDWLVCRADGVT